MPFDIGAWMAQNKVGQYPGTPQFGGGTATAAPAAAAKPAYAVSLEQMLAEASRLAGTEDTNQAREYGRLDKAGRDFSAGFNADEDKLTGLALGSQLDQIGQGSIDQSRQMRSQLGGRGIDPSSGTAAALASRANANQQALKYGAMRNAAMDSYGRRNANRTAQYAQQANLAQFGNQSPSLLRLDALTNQAEFDLADLVSKRQTDAAKYSAKQSAKAAKTAGIGNIIGSVLGGIL